MQFGVYPPTGDPQTLVPRCPMKGGRRCAHSTFPIPPDRTVCSVPHERELYLHYPTSAA